MPFLDRAQQREYARKWMADRRASFLAANGPCKKCGSSDRLEIHHRDRTQKTSHRVWSWAEAKRVAELAKCDVLCNACHKAETRAQICRPITHGSRSGYKRGCRCDACRTVTVDYNRRWLKKAKKGRPAGPRLVKCVVCALDISYLGAGRPPIYCSSCKANRATRPEAA